MLKVRQTFAIEFSCITPFVRMNVKPTIVSRLTTNAMCKKAVVDLNPLLKTSPSHPFGHKKNEGLRRKKTLKETLKGTRTLIHNQLKVCINEKSAVHAWRPWGVDSERRARSKRSISSMRAGKSWPLPCRSRWTYTNRIGSYRACRDYLGLDSGLR